MDKQQNESLDRDACTSSVDDVNQANMCAYEEMFLFEEHDEMFDHLLPNLIFNVTSVNNVASKVSLGILNHTSGPSLLSANGALARFRIVMDKYLECPTLLDPYLERIATTLSICARDIAHILYQKEWTVTTETITVLTGTSEKIVEAMDSTDTHQGIPTIEPVIDSKHPMEDVPYVYTLRRIFSAMYCLSKVRGRRHVQRFLSHDACDVEPVLYLLKRFQNHQDKSNNPNCENSDDLYPGTFIWESIFSLLLWLGMLSLVPFDLNTIDSTISIMEPKGEHRFDLEPNTIISEKDELLSHQNDRPTLASSILLAARGHLLDPGPTRETAAVCLASLLSRPDLEEVELQNFVLFACEVIENYYRSLSASHSTVEKIPADSVSQRFSNNPSSVFLCMGVLQTISAIFKTGNRSTLMFQHLRCIEKLWDKAILLAECTSTQNIGEGGGGGGALLLRKLLVKFFARVGCAYLPPRLASWRYQRGKRSLLENLTLLSSSSTGTSENQPASHWKRSGAEDLHRGPEDDVFHVPDQVEDSMAQMIHSLNDPATVVRWSAAKGIGRLSERLPVLCVDDVLDAILELCSDSERDNAWHGSCLALAELARRGLLLPDRLAEIMPIVVHAMQYDIRRGQRSIGSHVRDAACYTCWAFARAYAPSVLSPHVPELSKVIILTSLFDREINCRRAASASFQECVGRQGANNFKHGIEILTIADYFSLGNRVESFTHVALKVAQFHEYRYPIIDHLSDVKLFNWDADIRVLASKALHVLTHLDTLYFAEIILPRLIPKCTDQGSLFVRHGAILGVAEITLALSSSVPKDVANLIASIVPDVEKARLYRGRGGDIMRSATARLIECFSSANIALSIKQQIRILDSIDANLLHPNEDVQTSSAAALKALMTSYFPVGSSGPSDRLQARVVNKYIDIVKKEDNPAATRGFSLALGQLPSKLVAPNIGVLDSVIDTLCYAANAETRVGDEGDAETRRNAIQSLISVCETVGIGSVSIMSDHPIVSLNVQQVRKVYNSLFEAMDDYKADRRGDVGSWVRTVAIKGLVSVTLLALKARPSLNDTGSQFYVCEASGTDGYQFIDEVTICKTVGTLLKQLSEKLDYVRYHAGASLEKLLSEVLLVPHREELLTALDLNHNVKDGNRSYINWSQPSSTFPLVVKVMSLNKYFYYILSGLVVSVGGLTESITKSATAALLDYFRELRISGNMDEISRIADALTNFFREHSGDSRVILPLLVTYDKLFSHGCFDSVLADRSNSFARNLFECVKSEAQSCTDIKRLMAMIPVILGLLYCNDLELVMTNCLPFLMVFLAHRYPRLRRYTAEQLYINLLEDGHHDLFPLHENVDRAMTLLSEVLWDQDRGPHGTYKEARNTVSNLLGIHLRSMETDQSKSLARAGREKIVDEFESYASLVNATK